MPVAAGDLPFLALVLAALLFDFLIGFNDSSNVIAAMIASGAMEPVPALWLAALGEFAGPFLFGVAVATTIGAGIISPASVTASTILAALVGAVLWSLATWIVRLPSSSSHALIGGLIGAVASSTGLASLQLAGLLHVLLTLLVAPVVGLLAGYLFLHLVLFIVRGATPRVNRVFRAAQIPVSLALALSHGSNDGQKVMGIITLGMVALGRLDRFTVPLWVVLLSAVTLPAGALVGGLRVVRTTGTRIYRIRPVHGFAAQVVATAVILTTSLLGGPVSTTQVVNSAIVGVGAADRFSKVRWTVFRNILLTWFLTIPAAALVAAGMARVLRWAGMP